MGRIKCKNRIWSFDQYFEYLENNRDSIPGNLLWFILDDRRYFNGKESLHDSWLLNFNYSINNEEDKLVMNFLGPYHDITYRFTFQDVLFVKFKSKIKDFAQIDLEIHEFK